MPAFHSQFDGNQYRSIGNVSLLPVKSKSRGPAPIPEDPNADDIVDEAIYVFRPNCFFRNFEIQGGSDRVLIYLLLFIQDSFMELGANQNHMSVDSIFRTLQTRLAQNPCPPLRAYDRISGENLVDMDTLPECLLKLAAKNPNLAEGQRLLQTHAMQNFSLPGDSNFPLNALYDRPATKQDAETLKQYLAQLRMEVALRLPAKLYEGDKLSKWWICFSKRKFMGLTGVGTLA